VGGAGARPLEGIGIAVTREDEGGRLTGLLEGRGGRVHSWHVLRSAPPADPGPLERALGRLESYDWIVFSSARAVPAVVEGVVRPPAGVRVAAVGTATAEALRARGWPVHVVPEEHTGAALVEALRGEMEGGGGCRVLFPASALAREEIPVGLRALGAEVEQVEAYRMLPAALDPERCRRALEAGEVDVVTFTSPSAVEGLGEALGEPLLRAVLRRTEVVVIGPTTAAAARGRGATRVRVAEPHTLEGLVEAVVAAVGARRG